MYQKNCHTPFLIQIQLEGLFEVLHESILKSDNGMDEAVFSKYCQWQAVSKSSRDFICEKQRNYSFELVLLASIFFFLYNLKFVFLPFSSSLLVIGAVFLLMACFKFGVRNFIFHKKKLATVLLPFILNLAYCTISYILQGSENHSLIYNSLLTILFIVGVYSFSSIVDSRNINLHRLLFLIVAVIFLQAIFIILYYAHSGTRAVIDPLLPIGGNFDESPLSRSRGFSNTPGATLSAIQSIGLLFSCYFLISARHFLTVFFWILVPSTIIISIALTGRTGLLAIPLCLLYMLITNLSSYRRLMALMWKLLMLGVILTISIFLFYEMYFWFTGALGVGVLNITVNWILLPFVSDASLPDDRNIWFVLKSFLMTPRSDLLFVFGNIDMFYSINKFTDLGYVRNLFGLGVLGSLIYYSGYLSIILLSIVQAHRKNDKLLFLFFGIWLVILEIKEPFLRTLGFNFIILLLHFSLVFDLKRWREPLIT